MTDKDMALEATDIIRTVAGHQRGFKRIIGQLLNKMLYWYHKSI